MCRMTAYIERNGGVLLQTEAIVLSRDIPFCLRWRSNRSSDVPPSSLYQNPCGRPEVLFSAGFRLRRMPRSGIRHIVVLHFKGLAVSAKSLLSIQRLAFYPNHNCRCARFVAFVSIGPRRPDLPVNEDILRSHV